MFLLCSLTVDLSVRLSGCFFLPCSFLSGYDFLWREKPALNPLFGWMNQSSSLSLLSSFLLTKNLHLQTYAYKYSCQVLLDLFLSLSLQK